jgi:hypothetical protein
VCLGVLGAAAFVKQAAETVYDRQALLNRAAQ